MEKMTLVLIAAICAFVLVLLYALAYVGGRADKRMEQMRNHEKIECGVINDTGKRGGDQNEPR